MRGGSQGGMGGFGQWEGPNRGRGMGGVTTEEHLVPANKTGLVIGKGKELLVLLFFLLFHFLVLPSCTSSTNEA